MCNPTEEQQIQKWIDDNKKMILESYGDLIQQWIKSDAQLTCFYNTNKEQLQELLIKQLKQWIQSDKEWTARCFKSNEDIQTLIQALLESKKEQIIACIKCESQKKTSTICSKVKRLKRFVAW